MTKPVFELKGFLAGVGSNILRPIETKSEADSMAEIAGELLSYFIVQFSNLQACVGELLYTARAQPDLVRFWLGEISVLSPERLVEWLPKTIFVEGVGKRRLEPLLAMISDGKVEYRRPRTRISVLGRCFEIEEEIHKSIQTYRERNNKSSGMTHLIHTLDQLSTDLDIAVNKLKSLMP